MKRQALDNGTWFDLDKAESFSEETYWNGNNHISIATGSQWEHQELYRTANGRWVLNAWSQWQGSRESWTEIDNEAAARWLVSNSKEPHNACAGEYASLEI
jgi:hypothetical protein